MSWGEVTLGSLYKVASSKRVLKSDWKTEGIPFYRGREITALSRFDFIENELYISEEMYSDFSKKHGVPQAEDIMITAIGTIGNSYIVKDSDRFYFKDASVLWLKKEKEVDSKFINYWLKSKQFFSQLDVGLGATVDTLTINKVQSLKIYIPSLSTQQKTVSKLDAIFDEIDKAALATETNINNAQALFQSYLFDVFHKPNLEWDKKALKDICKKITDGSHNPPKGIEFSDFLMLSSKNIENDKMTFDSPRYLTESDFNLENKRTTVSYGDVLLTIVGTIGRCAVVENKNIKVALQRSVAVIKPTEVINSRFLMYAFLSKSKFLNERARGVAQKGIYLETLRELDISFPTYENQLLIVERLDALSSEIKRISSKYAEKLEKIANLRSSVLVKAFNGELVKD